MALTDENGGGIPATMLVAPAGNFGGMPYPVYGGNQGGNNGFGDGGWWLILLFLLLIAGGGWNNGNGNGGGAFTGNGGGMNLYPWMNQAEITTQGFQNSLMHDSITSIRDGVSNLSTQLCNCCGDMQMSLANGLAGVNANMANGFSAAEIAANGRQMANMQTAFAGQMAMNQGFNQLGSQFADCCCENRLGIADLKYTIATENCADRYEAAQNTRDIIDSQTRGTQAVLDKLCQLELDGVRGQLAQAQRENTGLQNQLNMANLAASQIAQTAQIRDGQNASVAALVNELRSCPIPAQPVYGSQPIFTCPNNNNGGCGCGCGVA